MTSLKSKDWEAWINLMPPSPFELIVIGKVETPAGNKVPHLSEASPQGINPQILILDLTIVQQGEIGTKDIAFRDARFEKAATKGQYTQVEIRYEGASIAAIDVKEVH